MSKTKQREWHRRSKELVQMLAALYPQLFTAEQWRDHKPLKLGIAADILAGGVMTEQGVKHALTFYCHQRRMYHKALAKGGPRFDLAGEPCGTVTEEQATHAAELLQRFDARRRERAAGRP